MSRLEDLVTQVHNPNENPDGSSDNAAPAPAPAPAPAKKKSGFFCCGGSRTRNQTAQPSTTSTNGATVNRAGSSGQRVGTLSISAGSDANGNDVPRDLINSPRPGSTATGGAKATAPYREDALLPPLTPRKTGKKCLVLDLDETLLHSSFKPVDRCDFVVPVEIEGRVHHVYVAKRPYVDEFMKRMGELYEVVVFTASLAKYADPVLDLLDIHKVVDYRLFRESCSCFKGAYVKDMGRMGRDLTKIMILDNSPHSYAFNPENAIPCETWFNDYEDTELRDLISVFEELASPEVDDVMVALERMKISAPLSLTEDDSASYSDSITDDGTDAS